MIEQFKPSKEFTDKLVKKLIEVNSDSSLIFNRNRHEAVQIRFGTILISLIRHCILMNQREKILTKRNKLAGDFDLFLKVQLDFKPSDDVEELFEELTTEFKLWLIIHGKKIPEYSLIMRADDEVYVYFSEKEFKEIKLR